MTPATSIGTMRAFALQEFGKPGSLQEVPAPKPNDGEILVRIRAAGVNPFDLFIVSGMAKEMMEHRFPLVPGVDAAGVIEGVGAGVTRWSVGDEVFGLFGKPFAGEGTFAEYIVAPAEGLIARKPSSLEFAQAAALPTPGLAAFQSVQAVTPKRGDTILIIGAAGGVGSYAVQLATRDGAKVIATGLPGQEEYLRSLGATQVIDFTNQDVVGTVKSTHPEGVEGLIDLVSRDAESLGRNAQVLRTGGKVATTMNAADPESLGRLGVEGTNVLAYASSPQDLEWLAQLVSNGELKVPISQVFALEETGQALAKLQTGEVQGKIVLDCSPG